MEITGNVGDIGLKRFPIIETHAQKVVYSYLVSYTIAG